MHSVSRSTEGCEEGECSNSLSKDGRGKSADIIFLEETIQKQAELIQEIKGELLNGIEMEKDEILLTRNKILEQEIRLLRCTIRQLKKELTEAKQLSLEACEVYQKEKKSYLNQKEEMDKRQEQLSKTIDSIDHLQIELARANRQINMQDSEARQQLLNIELQKERMQDAKKIVSLQSKVHSMKQKEELLSNELGEVHKKLEICLQNQIKGLESFVGHSKFDEKDVNTDISGNYQSDFRENHEKLMSLMETLQKQIESIKSRKAISQEQSELYKQIGCFTTKILYLEKEIAEVNQSKDIVMADLKKSNEEINYLKSELQKAEKKLSDSEKNFDIIHRSLMEENGKIKLQKAQLRCDLIDLKRKYFRLQNELTYGQGDEASHAQLKISEMANINKCFDKELGLFCGTAKCSVLSIENVSNSTVEGNQKEAKFKLCDINLSPVHELQTPGEKNCAVEMSFKMKLEHCNKELTTLKASYNTDINMLKKQLLVAQEEKIELSNALQFIDVQCERLLENKNYLEKSLNTAIHELQDIKTKLSVAEHHLASTNELKAQLKEITFEKNRLLTKVEYLTEELRETHNDYREELARITQQVNSLKDDEGTSTNEKLRAEKHYLNTMIKSLERQLEQKNNEFTHLNKDLAELHDSHAKIIDENKKLRNGLALSIEKLEKYRDELENSKSLNANLEENLRKTKDNEDCLKSRLDVMVQTVDEKDRLIAYLQAQINLKGSLKLQRNSSHSTLMSYDDGLFMDIAIPERQQFHSTNRQSSSSSSVKIHYDRETSPIISLVNDDKKHYTAPTSTLSITTQYISNDVPLSPSSAAHIGTMKHDIPHRWKNYFNLKQAKCVVCLEGLPRLRHSLKCGECDVVVHRGCSFSVANTCGLPIQCADYYLDAYQKNNMNMSGWIKIWKSDGAMSNRWRSVWATLDNHYLRFFDNEGLAVPINKGQAIFEIDLNQEQWRIYMQPASETVVKNSVSPESYALLIELRIKRCNLFVLAPTIQAKQRWLQALQAATNRRMFKQRRSVSFSGSIMLLALDAPLNLTIHCSKVIENWLLLGTQEGLFVTQINPMHIPFTVMGITAVYHMELIEELEMLAAICGNQRQLVFIHMSDLKAIFKSNGMAIRATPLANVTSCHIMTLYSDSVNQLYFLFIADACKIDILQFNSRLSIFTQFDSLQTKEPACCLLSVPGGLIYGADQFYFVDIKTFVVRPLLIANAHVDWPRAAAVIGNNEFLLAFHNFGIFIDIDGNKTRTEIIDWSRAPLEFVYAAPYLYVVHLETLEILKLAEYEGLNSKTLLDERDVFRCKNAHFIGRGRHDEVLFTLSDNDRTEIHSFCKGSEYKTHGPHIVADS